MAKSRSFAFQSALVSNRGLAVAGTAALVVALVFFALR
jgi:hypothetical protein